MNKGQPGARRCGTRENGDSRAGLESRSVDGRSDLLASGFDVADGLLGRLEVARGGAGHGLDDTVEAADERVEAMFGRAGAGERGGGRRRGGWIEEVVVSAGQNFQSYNVGENSLALVADAQAGRLVTGETGVVDWQSAGTGVLALSGDEVGSERLSPHQLVDGVERDWVFELAPRELMRRDSHAEPARAETRSAEVCIVLGLLNDQSEVF